MNIERKIIVATAPNATAFDQDLAAWQSRDARLTTILLVGKIITRTGDHLCRVRNISADGMLVECDTPLSVDEPVTIELRNLNVVTAHVRWIRDGRIGIQFDATADVEDLLQQPAGMKLRPRAPRLGADCPIVIWHIGRNHSATLIDVSQTGCRLKVAEPFVAGADVRITIPDLPARRATLRWSGNGLAGFAFNEPLSFAELKAWDTGRDIGA